MLVFFAQQPVPIGSLCYDARQEGSRIQDAGRLAAAARASLGNGYVPFFVSIKLTLFISVVVYWCTVGEPKDQIYLPVNIPYPSLVFSNLSPAPYSRQHLSTDIGANRTQFPVHVL